MLSALFALVLASGAIAAGVGYVRKASAMRHFVSTPGKVLARDVAPLPSGDTREAAFGTGGGYVPKVTYRYAANGKEFTGDRFAYAYRGLKKAIAQKKADAMPDPVQVWFDPGNPQDAYLQRHTPGLGWVIIAGGTLGALASVAWMLA